MSGRKRGRVFEPEGRSRQHPAELIRERLERAEQEHGPLVCRTYIGNGMVVCRHTDGTTYHERLPEGSSY